MLLNALFTVALLGVAGLAMLSAGAAMTRVSVERAAQNVLGAEYQQAVASAQSSLETALRNGRPPSPFPTFAPLPPQCMGARCAYTAHATIALDASQFASAASCDLPATNCASNVQANPYVGEGRLTARITVTVDASDGSHLATRSTDVTWRTFDVAPYAAVTGSQDATLGGTATASSLGDDGGSPPATPNPCAASPTGSDGTVVRVAYENAQTNACSDGSIWRDSSYSVPPSAPHGWSP